MKARVRFGLVLVMAIAMAALPAPGQTTDGPGQTTNGLEMGGTFIDDDLFPSEPAIEALVANGITNGCGGDRFCPAASVTRGQMAAFLARALKEEGGDGPTLSDVVPGTFYYGAVHRLLDRGIVTGYPDGTFRPELPVTRAEMSALLARALDLVADQTEGTFTDVSESDWFAPHVSALLNAGITTGCGGDRFCPTAVVTREQMALFIARAFHLSLPTVPPRISPLNGMPVSGMTSMRRVIAVKIDNASRARPQSGVEQADAMMELMVEGGLSRMVGLFHTSDATYLGPIRSVRPTDAVLESLGATVGISGAQRWIADLVAAEGVPIIREGEVGPPTMFRISQRVAPYNLYTNTIELRREADSRGYSDLPPPALFRFGQFQHDNAPLASTIDVSWSDPVSTVWTWNGTRYDRSMGTTPHSWRNQAGTEGRIQADTLIVIFGQYYEVGAPPGVNGSIVPAMSTIGSGRLLVFSNGRVLDGTWSRPDNETWFTFLVGGAELVISPGIPWIHIIPHDRPVTWRPVTWRPVTWRPVTSS